MIGSNSSKLIYALLDEGSTVTIINSDVIKEIGIKSSHTSVSLKGIGDEILTMSNQKVILNVKASNTYFEIKNVLVVKNLGLPYQSLSDNLTNLCYENTGIYVNPYKTFPKMLIGQDCIKLILTREFHQIVNTELILSRCSLGWTIHGNVNGTTSSIVNNIKAEYADCTCSEKTDELNNLMKKYFDTDSLGVKHQVRMKSEYKHALDIIFRCKTSSKNEI